MGAEPGMVSVPALKFAARHILVDLAEVKSLAKATGAPWLRLVDVGPARAEFVLPTFTAPAPLRRVLDTPIASGHIGTTKTLKPQTLATAKYGITRRPIQCLDMDCSQVQMRYTPE